ncbi:phosphatidylinositol N-acetylglucosaminyltransferase subunit P, putative [Babesia microti strain RI]|uniref:Phosphatidylinositol N-acetylglucosaminyltransferase subunit P, putative n=1 Tax=Babesia microti (strain RI) TaxID=1133968 RepID=I7JCU2_BABMR|nr:phosphatidylinositol N-acetylglucosaminyltransferase subunit P, putative [Babesia microti strain RI]CCF75445.1 phosphatidylinositol N-acetylglucosaminyltransferase subunit P, putative [Babesia microti strain RI]|eukprot:XP_012649853.1 phosphatidylinositol N-acetylglucosaminyltransferase subunit P, putative [Babesia microti strain RI]
MNSVVRDFLFWVFCIILYIVYLCWTFIPDSILHIATHLLRHWSLVIPALGVVLYNSLSNYYYITSKMHNVSIDSINNIKDKYSKYADKGPSINENRMVDIPVTAISRQLYG